MFGKLIGTLVGGALGLAALYLAGAIGYEIGKESAEHSKPIDSDFDDDVKDEDNNEVYAYRDLIHEKKVGKLGMLMGLRKIISGKSKSTVGSIISDPDNCKVEAYVQEGVVHICVYKRRE